MHEQDGVDQSPLDAGVLDAWAAPEPPPQFAGRVIAAMSESGAAGADASPGVPRRRGRWAAFAMAVASVATVTVVMRAGSQLPGAQGSVRATERSTVRLAHRGVLVAEPGAHVDWHVSRRGVTSVKQPRGDVFYRVDRGGPFVVDTPGGRVEVKGTCFSVEVIAMKPSKQTLAGAAVGAALAATIVVTVYEGRVLFARDGENNVAAVAGQTVVSRPGYAAVIEPTKSSGHAAARVAVAAAPPDGISRGQLLQRDEAHRKDIATLRAKLALAQRDVAAARRASRSPAGGDDDVDADGRPWFDPSPETLKTMAKNCQVRYDTPPFLGNTPMQVPADRAGDLGLSADEVGGVNAVLHTLHAQIAQRLRALYIEATGDKQGADSLSPEAMINELRDKSAKGEMGRIQQRIAQERAGLVAAPTDLAKLTPLDRYFRLLAGLGVETEQALAAKIGPQKARAVREKLGGWGRRMEFGGCPDSGKQRMKVRERD